MKKETWVKRIRKACRAAGTYRDYFEPVISSLAETLETRDKVRKYYEDEGAIPVVQMTNKGGHTNTVKNPILVIYDDMNNTALAYWKELGLTPKALKGIDEKAMRTSKKTASLGEALRDIGI